MDFVTPIIILYLTSIWDGIYKYNAAMDSASSTVGLKLEPHCFIYICLYLGKLAPLKVCRISYQQFLFAMY